MIKTASSWYSGRVEQQVNLVRWGDWGQPVLIFPTAGGDAEEIERMHLIEALGPLIDGGRIKVYSCDNVAGRALRQDRFGRVPLRAPQPLRGLRRRRDRPGDLHRLSDGGAEVVAAGASLGAFMAVAYPRATHGCSAPRWG